MYKIVIADDEEIERRAMSIKLKKNIKNIKICSLDADGEELLSSVRKYEPDIIIVDIEMPVMTGLEVISKIRKEGLIPNGKILLYTAYGQFEYAQKALKEKVDDYILKPVSIKEFINIVNKCILQLDKERSEKSENNHMQQMFTQVKEKVEDDFIKMVSRPNITERQKMLFEYVLGKDYKCGSIVAFLIQINDQSVDILDNIHILKDTSEKLKNVLLEYHGIVSKRINDEIYCFIPHYENKIIAEKYGIIEIVKLIINQVNIKKEVSIKAGIGRSCSEYSELFESYKNSFQALHEKNIKSSVIHIEDIKKEMAEKNPFFDNEKRLTKCILTKEKNLCEKIVVLSFYKVKEMSVQRIADEVLESAIQIVSSLIEYLSKEQEEKYNLISLCSQMQKLNDWKSLRVWYLDLMYSLMNAVQTSYKKNPNKLVQRSIDYIKDNYTENISLEMIASEIGVNPFYLSHIFTIEVGLNYSTYLNDFRINKACNLLKEYNYLTRELAIEVGFSSPEYFSKVFKKKTGYTVKEYKSII